MTYSFRRRVRHAGVVGVALVALSIIAPHCGPLKSLERISRDWRYRYFNRAASASTDVVVIDIDEASLKIMAPHLGRWPWPRRVYKELLAFLSIGEARLVLFDVLFTERMLGSRDDLELFEMSLHLGNVSHGVNLLEDRADGGDGVGTFPVGFPHRYALQTKHLEKFPSLKTYLDAVVHSKEIFPLLNRLHVATFPEDGDGVFRRAPLVFKLGDSWLPSLALAGIGLTQSATVEFDGTLNVVDNERRYSIPVDGDGLMPIHYYRYDRDPRSVSIASVFDAARRLQLGEELGEQAISPFEFRDKIVVVGASAVGLSDLKTTPVRSAYPGALVQATAISNILSHDYLKTIPVWLFSLIVFCLAAASLSSVLFVESYWIKAVGVCAGCGVYGGLSVWAFQRWGWDVGLATPLLMAGLGVFEALVYVGVIEGRDKRRMQSTLSKYLSPQVTQTLIETGQDPHAEDGRQEELSVLFTDIRSFTTISEAHPASIVVHHLNEYLGRMTGIIFEEAGTLDKFVGDAIMAFWGAPLKNDHHAESAVRCALKMQRAVTVLRSELGGDSPFAFKTGIGINSGTVVVGNIGSNQRLDYTVIGDNVNLAARIESVTKDFRAPILIGETTYEAVKNAIVCRVIDERVQIKGKMQYIKLFQPLCEVEARERLVCQQLSDSFENALHAYRRGDFEGARALFMKIDMANNGTDGPSQLYIERCQYWMANPPEDWRGYDTQYASKH